MAVTSEFSVIQHYFEELTTCRDDVALGIGDDCALLNCPPDHQLAISIDTLVEGVHFFPDVEAEHLGYKSLAVGLSDLAAMGAQPAWFTLALTLPEINESWLRGFSAGLAKLAQPYNLQLVGGDTTRGPLTISIQVHGFVKKGQALRRDGAQVGDLVYVTGTVGDAGAALKMLQNDEYSSIFSEDEKQFLRRRLECPSPRNTIGESLSSIATSAIDISDGLVADLAHITEKSGVSACLDLSALPLSKALTKLTRQEAEQLALYSGDDYELCFTVKAGEKQRLESTLRDSCTQIGTIVEGTGIHYYHDKQKIELMTKGGYDHFSK